MYRTPIARRVEAMKTKAITRPKKARTRNRAARRACWMKFMRLGLLWPEKVACGARPDAGRQWRPAGSGGAPCLFILGSIGGFPGESAMLVVSIVFFRTPHMSTTIQDIRAILSRVINPDTRKTLAVTES